MPASLHKPLQHPPSVCVSREASGETHISFLEAVTEKSVAAANFLFQCTEAAKVRVALNEKKDVTFRVEQDAHAVIAKLLRDVDGERAAAEREQAAIDIGSSN